MSPDNSAELDAVKDEFAARWHAGERPTLSEYLETYPQFHDELVDFIVSFGQLFAVPLGDDGEECATDGAREAMRRGIAAARTNAGTIVGRLEEISLEQGEFARRTRFPFEALAQFHRERVSAPIPFWTRIADHLQVTIEQAQRFLAPQPGALAHRSARRAAVKDVSFEQLLVKARDAGMMSQEDFDYWSAEASRL